MFFPLVPFDEDERETSVWFLDHNYLENMNAMFRKVNGEIHMCYSFNLYCVYIYESRLSFVHVALILSIFNSS